MATGVSSWSTTAATNASADAAVNYLEGQAPSSLNDSARAAMASVAKWRDDIVGINVTGGSGTAYTISSNQVITSNQNGFTVQFTPNATNTGAVTLSVDGQAAAPLRFLTGIDLPGGVLVSGSLYQATYRTASGEWLLHSFNASIIYSIPVGGIIPFAGSSVPNSSFTVPVGQAISRGTYSALFSLIGATYGSGDGSTTFNLPDLVGRVPAMFDGGGARINASRGGVNGAALGASGGADSYTILTPNLPAYTPAGGVSNGAITIANLKSAAQNGDGAHGALSYYSDAANQGTVNSTPSQASSSFSGSPQGGTSTPFSMMQPTLVLNYIMRII